MKIQSKDRKLVTAGGLKARKVSKTLVVLGAAVALCFAGLSGLGATTASADTSGCVTKDEFHKVKRDMSKHRVKRIFDTGGRQEFRSGRYSSREYNACRRFGSVWVDYKSGDVSGKMAIW